MKKGLTAAQARCLDEVRAAGASGRAYNGRARRTIEALERAGLVTATMDLVPHVGDRFTERWTVRPVEPVRETARDTCVLRVRFVSVGSVEVDARRVRLWALSPRTFWRAATGGPAFEACSRHDPGECPRRCAAMFGTYRMVVADVAAG